jgi:hypothetical protein
LSLVGTPRYGVRLVAVCKDRCAVRAVGALIPNAVWLAVKSIGISARGLTLEKSRAYRRQGLDAIVAASDKNKAHADTGFQRQVVRLYAIHRILGD